MHPLSRNGLVYEYLRIQYAYPDASEEEHLAHFRQLVRSGAVQISRAEPTDIVPAGQEMTLGSHEFPPHSFLTPTERIELVLRERDIFMQNAIMENPHRVPAEFVQALNEAIAGVLSSFVLTDLFYYYRLEQPVKAAVAEQSGIVFHPVSGNGLLYEWLRLQYQYPDKTEAERITLFRQSARQGLEANRPALTNIVPQEHITMLFPTAESHTSPAVRETLFSLNWYDMNVVHNGGSRENLFIVFLFSDSTDAYNSFITSFNSNVEFVFHTLWNIYKAEQSALAAQIEPQGLILHPISRNGLLFEWLRLQYEHPNATEAERLALFRQSARQGAVQVNRAGPIDFHIRSHQPVSIPLEDTVRIRPPGANELIHQGLIVP